jgi:hypothetical protein
MPCCAPQFSATPSTTGGITKSGLHWAENSAAPYPVGDTTLAGEAAGLLIRTLLGYNNKGNLTIYPCVAPSGYSGTNPLTSAFGGYLMCYVVSDPTVNMMHVLVVNDLNGQSVTGGSTALGGISTSADMTNPAPFGMTLDFTIDLTGLGISSTLGSYFAITEVSQVPAPTAGISATQYAFGEVTASGRVTGPIFHQLPPFGVMRVSASTVAQTVTTLACQQSTMIVAGANVNKNYGSAQTFKVGTSTTSTHDTTSIGLMLFDLTNPGGANAVNAAAGSSIVLLNVNVAVGGISPNSEATVLQVIGITPCGPGTSWNENTITWSSAGFIVSSTAGPQGAISSVGGNFVILQGTNPGNDFVGHITVSASDEGGSAQQVDVTDYVQTAAAGGATKVAFAIVRRHIARPLMPHVPGRAHGCRHAIRRASCLGHPLQCLVCAGWGNCQTPSSSPNCRLADIEYGNRCSL